MHSADSRCSSGGAGVKCRDSREFVDPWGARARAIRPPAGRRLSCTHGMVCRVSTPRKTRVAVVFGGRSTEHGISCVSAGSILNALDPDEFEVVPIGITREGRWVLTAGDGKSLAIADRALPEITAGSG